MDQMVKKMKCSDIHKGDCGAESFSLQYDAQFKAIMVVCDSCGSRITHGRAAVKFLKNPQFKSKIEIDDTVSLKLFKKKSPTLCRSHILGMNGKALCNSCSPTAEELENTLVGTINDCGCMSCIKRVRSRGYTEVDLV